MNSYVFTYINIERHNWSHCFALSHWGWRHKHHSVTVKGESVVSNYPPVSGGKMRLHDAIIIIFTKIIQPCYHNPGEDHVRLIICGLTNEA